jgi:hypothetical protein
MTKLRNWWQANDIGIYVLGAIAAAFLAGYVVGTTHPREPHYGQETNELLSVGFGVIDPEGYEVAYFTPDGRHNRLADIYGGTLD